MLCGAGARAGEKMNSLRRRPSTVFKRKCSKTRDDVKNIWPESLARNISRTEREENHLPKQTFLSDIARPHMCMIYIPKLNIHHMT